ncbi:MAG: hypothetical protein RLZZ142_1883, partial [Verrucomicrobiota bacterium]
MLIRARIVLPMDSPALENGAVRIENGQIVALGPAKALPAFPGETITELGESILMPGLINAHCHLDYSSLKNAISRPKSFTEWVLRLNSVKRQLSSEDILQSIARGYEEAARFGTTTVCTMVAFPELMARIPPPPLRTWWFYEMIDIRHRETSEAVVEGALEFFGERQDPLSRFGLNP